MFFQGITRLQLTEIQFKDNKIEKGWLDGINLSINELNIASANLNKLGKESFSGDTFKNLDILTLSDTKIYTFRKNIFENSTIATLQINFKDTFTVDFEKNAFGALAKTLSTLQLQRCLSDDVLFNITGPNAERMKNLNFLDLRYNNLVILKDNSFINVPSLKSLFLSYSSIHNIEPNVFNFYQSIIRLDITNNNLKTLQQSVFKNVDSGISIDNNNWTCNCELLWLRDLYISEPNLFVDKFYCTVANRTTVPYDKVDFCPNNQTTEETTKLTSTSTKPTTSNPTQTTDTTKSSVLTTIPTTISPTQTTDTTKFSIVTTTSIKTTTTNPTQTTKTTKSSSGTTSHSTVTTLDPTVTTPSQPISTPTPPHSINVNCNTTVVSPLLHRQLFDSYNITVRNESVVIQFIPISDDDQKYILSIDGEINSDTLLWTKNQQPVSCIKNAETNVLYETYLDYEQTYVFCLLQFEHEVTSPFDCAAITTPPSFDKQTWLPNSFKFPIILGITGSLIAAILISALTMFFCVRQHPSLIKGNKRVIIVESEAADAIVMPKTYYDEVNYTPPSLHSHSNGYLTPKYNGVYSQRSIPGHLRTISEHTTYVLPKRNGRLRKGHYRRETTVQHVMQGYDDHLYEPPPLPPNHPSELRKTTRISLNSTKV